MLKYNLIVLCAVLAITPAGVAHAEMHGDHSHDAPASQCATAKAYKAIAVLYPTAGNNTHGTVEFVQEGDKVRMTAVVTGLDPHGTHGFHIHEFGDCSGLDALTTGGHYNPEGHPHGGPEDEHRHAGDFGNLKADENGVAKLELVLDNITVHCGPTCILGRGVIVHEQRDDLVSQPTGDAGARIACGVIGVAKDGQRKPGETAHAGAEK